MMHTASTFPVLHDYSLSRSMMLSALVCGGLVLAGLTLSPALADDVSTEATPLNAWNSTDAPDDVMGEPVVEADGAVKGHVGAVRMDPSPDVMQIQAIRIDPQKGTAFWVDANRVWRLPDAVRVAAASPQTAQAPWSVH